MTTCMVLSASTLTARNELVHGCAKQCPLISLYATGVSLDNRDDELFRDLKFQVKADHQCLTSPGVTATDGDIDPGDGIAVLIGKLVLHVVFEHAQVLTDELATLKDVRRVEDEGRDQFSGWCLDLDGIPVAVQNRPGLSAAFYRVSDRLTGRNPL